MADALGTFGAGPTGVVTAQEHRLAITAMLAGLSTGILDARTGVFPGPNSLALVTGTSTTGPMTVSVAAHQAATARTSAQGTYLGPTLEAATSLNIAAAPASNSRIDVVYVVQQDADPGVLTPDGSTGPVWAVATGTAASSPTKPSIPVGALELATVTVAAGATSTNGANVTISNTVRQTAARGGVVLARSGDTGLPAYDGQPRYLSGTGLQIGVGGAWITFFDPSARVRPGRRATKAGTQSVGTTWTPVSWDAAAGTTASAGMWDSSHPTRLVATRAGRYRMSLALGGALTNIQIRQNANGSNTAGTNLVGSAATGAANVATDEVVLAVGDYIEGFGIAASTTTMGTVAGYAASMTLTYIDVTS